MASSGILRTNWDLSTNKDVFKTLVSEWFNSTDRPPLVEYPRVVNDISSSDEYERMGRFAGLDYASEVVEGAQIPVQDPKFNTTKDYTQVAFGTGFRITDRMKRFEKIGLYQFLTENLRNMMLETKDIEVARLYNSAAVTTYAVGFDTYALAHAAHTCLDDAATTFSNYGNSALSTSSLESALNYFDYMYDDQGNIFTAQPDTLVVNRTLRWDADELLKSGGKPWEMSNTINPYKGEVTPFVYHRLTATTSWFLIAKSNPRFKLFVITSMAPDVKVYSVDSTRDTIVDSLQYFKFGFSDGRMVWVGDT